MHYLLPFSNKNLKKKQRRSPSALCFNNRVALPSQISDGAIMKSNILPESWKTYDTSRSQNYFNVRIFFHETSGKSKLDIMQCCAVESAAKHNPNRHIQLFIRPSENCSRSFKQTLTSLSFFSPTWLEVLSQYPNVSIILLNEEKYFYGTPLEEWYKSKRWQKSLFTKEHLSDYIRMLTLYKGGGLYLDMDMLTVRPYATDKFQNFLVYGSARMDHISNGAMHFESGHWVLEEIMQVLAKEYDPDSYLYHGPDMVSEIMKTVCGVVSGHPESNRCNNIKILPDNLFYPVPSITYKVLFEDNSNVANKELLNKINGSFGVHLWNSLSRQNNKFDAHSNQILAILARKHCPLTILRAMDFKDI